MKAVLISIQPKWCKLIASGEKTIEIRKTKPNMMLPAKCYIYETKGRTWQNKNEPKMQEGRGAVIGEFVCYRIIPVFRLGGSRFWLNEDLCRAACLSSDEIRKYAAGAEEVYAWKVSELKIYDKPKPLSEFKRWNRTGENAPCANVPSLYPPCKECKECNLKRPPQSWQYVEV